MSKISIGLIVRYKNTWSCSSEFSADGDGCLKCVFLPKCHMINCNYPCFDGNFVENHPRVRFKKI